MNDLVVYGKTQMECAGIRRRTINDTDDQQIDPLSDIRWTPLLSLYGTASSVFHSTEWLEALRRTYAFEPLAFVSSVRPGEPPVVLLRCRVDSRLTGRRLVSLPFSDHCEPLISSTDGFRNLLEEAKEAAGSAGCKYVEIRPLQLVPPPECGFVKSQSFCFHTLDLSPGPAELFGAFHRDCVQRKILRAEREGLVCEEGRSMEILRKFYSLQIMTRRRQQLPPQPFAWFRNLAECMGDKLNVLIASKDGRPVASILTLRHRTTLVYKYGCSDKTFSNLGGMPFLFWRAIKDAKGQGLLEFDLGRSDWDNEGLLQFKDRLGATRSTLNYWRYPASSVVPERQSWTMKVAKRIFSHLPDACLTAAGDLLYKHIG